ncbi:hypothetical protein ILUMI_07349 [Ignelater luminosus]|uniref:Zinc finger CCHC domain-containing protein 7 n=1 Tax=Ignelater luminosus TaxID=2038154 RepID=A0A8K0GGY6_IGNLU|nr:hypothetical protein ILUMI_07349 [Ignelater luminosus]
MWNDSEIDMEELEARLYGQVHHPTTDDFTCPSFNLPYNNTQDRSGNTYKRYFNQNRNREPMCSYKTGYEESTYFERPGNYPVNYQTGRNFYNPLGYIPEIALNNIVVLPPPSTHIFTQTQLPIQDLAKERKRQKKRSKRKARRDLASTFIGGKRYETDWKAFKEHYLTRKPEDSLNSSQNECQIIEPEKDIICISESDQSDCEITEKKEPVIVLSSDDEDTETNLPPLDVTCETTNEQQSRLEIKPLVDSSSDCLEKDTDTKNIVESKLVLLELNSTDDDVQLVESKPDEVIVIGGDDTQSAVSSLNDSNASSSLENNVITPPTLTNKELFRPGTPESTNDFLENSFSESNDVNLNVNSSQCLNIQKSGFDACETESSSSASDIENPCRNSTFIEQEFDVPPQDAVSELNLDSFTDYIASGSKNSKGLLTSQHSTPKYNANSLTKENKNEDVAERNSSDSSSESDYEDDKLTLIQDRPKAKSKLYLRTRASSETSEDCCVIEGSFKELKKNKGNISTPLPNLSPITSDEEISNCKTEKNSEIKNKKTQKKKSLPQRTSNTGEKRKYPKDVLEFIKSKRSKENENFMKAQSSDSSDNLSEVEITHDDDSSVKLLNVGSTISELSPASQPLKDTQNCVRFEDYWTEDMNKFYFESWGQEDFSLEKARKNMSDSPDKWKIIPSDRSYLKQTPRGPRCNRCNEYGHKAISCKKKPKPIKCSVCGAVGHFNTCCPKSICTSCGRRNYCLTNYCSRCTDLRHIKCRICLQYGHTNSHCPDLWRRYHLTTKTGPLKQPQNSNLKPTKDRWCSGCASNGHFEYECHYFNRIHAANNPTICSYDDVYDRSNTSTKKETPTQARTQSNNVNASHDSDRSNIYPNISSRIVSNVQNPYMQNQNFQQQNFIQQFPVFQSIPSLLSLQLQQGPNVFYQNANGMFTNRFVPKNVGSNTFHQNQQLSNNPLKNLNSNNKNQLQVDSDKSQRLYLNFDHSKGEGLVCPEGTRFLGELSDASNVKIKVIKRKKNKKFNYLCTLEGPRQQIVNVSKRILCYTDAYVRPPPSLMQMFQGKDFSLNALRECLAHTTNSEVNWLSTSKVLYTKIKAIQRKLYKSESLKEIAVLQNKLKMRYITLNAVINGKLPVETGGKHMEILKRYTKSNNNLNDEQLKMLKESYNYVFNNSNKLNIAYNALIDNLPTKMGLENEMKQLVEDGIAMCVKDNLSELSTSLKATYKIMVKRKYLERNVLRFRKLYEIIKSKDQQMNAVKNINPNQKA